MSTQICAIYALLHSRESHHVPRFILEEIIDRHIPWPYFDGASNEDGTCGGGLLLFFNDQHFLKSKICLERYQQLCKASPLKFFFARILRKTIILLKTLGTA